MFSIAVAYVMRHSPALKQQTAEARSLFNVITDKRHGHEKSKHRVPKSLRLSFPGELDTLKVAAALAHHENNDADPNGYVKPRPAASLREYLARGRVAVIEDDQDEIRALCVAYEHMISDMPTYDISIPVSEIGSVLSRAKGLGLSKLTVAALSLKIEGDKKSSHPIIAKVAVNNDPANRLFGAHLGWEPVTYLPTVRAYYNSDAGLTVCNPSYSELRNWYECREDAIANSTEVITSTRGFVRHRDGQDVPLEMELH